LSLINILNPNFPKPTEHAKPKESTWNCPESASHELPCFY
jgi:hypothetical protein